MKSAKSISYLKRENNLGARIGNNNKNDYFLHLYYYVFTEVPKEALLCLGYRLCLSEIKSV